MLTLQDLQDREAAFKAEVAGRHYGSEMHATARWFFYQGWLAARQKDQQHAEKQRALDPPDRLVMGACLGAVACMLVIGLLSASGVCK